MAESKVGRMAAAFQQCDGLEKVAAGVSVATIVVFIGFWMFQIRSVIELLQLAYG